MRLLPLFTSACLLLLLFLGLTDCRSPESDGLYVIPLTDDLRSAGSSRYQVYWGIADSARYAGLLSDMDSISRLGERHYSFNVNDTLRALTLVNGEVRSPFPVSGWERHVDSISGYKSVVRLLGNERVVVKIPSAQVVLGGDSITIGLMRVIDRAFEWQTFDLNFPDYLVLMPKGEEVVYVAMDSDNIGPIGRQTVFRVGRRYYVLKSVSDNYRSLTVEEMPEARGMELTAELDTYYKPIPVNDMEGNPTSIRHKQGRDLAVYFFSLGGVIPEMVVKTDSLYRSLPENRRSELDIALVSRNALPDSLRAFIARHDLQMPVYQSSGATCQRLNCTAYLPSFVAVNERGRIVTFQGRQASLVRKLEDMLE